MRNLQQFSVIFATDCSQLVKIVLEPKEWSASASYLEDIKILKRSFNSSELIHIPQTPNSKADSLIRRRENNHSLSFIWMRSYKFGLQSVNEYVYVADKRKKV